ncbi:GNAT family N-acetyltransferase [Shimazuella kribbensis]|uniref:GNAT family N-acetyltransferase n=1 Tax=Shimazuella kribbensis TaxID=139808 RepID=UPI00040FF787|nr:GNAT family N-acetyltransferase [Shimazuella kribbensis]
MISTDIKLETWSESCLSLLHQLNAPELMEHLGGPETEAQILARHNRYLNLGETGKMYYIQFCSTGEVVGSVGYWERTWTEEKIYEMGWAVLPEFQGKGIATKAVAVAIDKARLEKKHTSIHAFPSIDNSASNAICRKLNFKLVQECKFEYPVGHFITSNDWEYEL